METVVIVVLQLEDVHVVLVTEMHDEVAHEHHLGHDEDEDGVVHDVMIAEATEEIEDADYVATYLELMYGMPLEDEVEVIADEVLLVEDEIEVHVLALHDVMLLHVEVEDEELVD